MVNPLGERPDDGGIEEPEDVTDVDEREFASWLSTNGEAVKSVLSDLTRVYHRDSERYDIKNVGVSHVPPDADYVGVQLDLPAEMDPKVEGANILRLLDDLCSHEVAHLNWTPLDAKREFAECYPGFGQLPGFVQNAIEDEYIDTKRKQRWSGMGEKLAYYTWLHMNTDERSPPVDEVVSEHGMENAMMNALLQTCLAGYVKGVDDAPDEIAEAMSRIEPLIRKARATDNPDGRTLLCHAIMNILIRYLPDPDEFDPDAMENKKRGTSAMDDPESAPDAMEPDIDLPDEIKEQVEELMEDMAESDELPDPTPGEDMPEPGDSDAIGDMPMPSPDAEDGDSGSEPGEPGDTDGLSGDETGVDEEPGSPGENPEGKGGETGDAEAEDEAGSAGDGSAGETEVRPEIMAAVEEHGAENLVVN